MAEYPKHLTDLGDRSALVGEIESLRRELNSEQSHTELLRNQLEIKDNQIKAASEREQQTNVLMKDLHALMGDLQHRLPLPAGNALPHPQLRPKTNVEDAELSVESESTKVSRQKRKKANTTQPSKKASRKTTSTAFPTFQRWFNSIRR